MLFFMMSGGKDNSTLRKIDVTSIALSRKRAYLTDFSDFRRTTMGQVYVAQHGKNGTDCNTDSKTKLGLAFSFKRAAL
jgi:hypothetical protein